MKNLKPYLKAHRNAEDAYNRTTKSNVMAVVIKTYLFDTLMTVEFYSYKTNNDRKDNFDLREDFPMSIGSNQSIEEMQKTDSQSIQAI